MLLCWVQGEGNGTPLQYCCPENPMDGGAWWVAVHGVTKSQTQLSDFTFTFHFHALEKEMATHSSVLAWRIPWTEKPSGYSPWGRTESDTTEAIWRQQQHVECIYIYNCYIFLLNWSLDHYVMSFFIPCLCFKVCFVWYKYFYSIFLLISICIDSLFHPFSFVCMFRS